MDGFQEIKYTLYKREGRKIKKEFLRPAIA